MSAAWRLTSCSRGRLAGGRVGCGHARPPAPGGAEGGGILRVDEDACLGGDELGRSADAGGEHACAPSPSPRASPGRRARSATAGRGRRRRRPTGAPPTAGSARRGVTFGASSSAARSGPSPTNASRPRPSDANASARRTTFLRSISEPTQRKAGPSPSQPSSRRASAAGRGENASRSTPQIGDLDLRLGRRDPVGEATGEPARVGDHRGGAADHPAGGRGDAGDPAEVGDVLAVGHHDERRAGGAGGERAGGPGREEEVGEDDVGPEAAGRRAGLADQRAGTSSGAPRAG